MGAVGGVLVDEHGDVMATYGEEVDPGADDVAIVGAPFQRGAFIMRSSPYAPFFGRDEAELLKGLGYFMDLALDRCSRGEWEREFIANAAHELRTPLTVLSGLATTLSTWGHSMSPGKVDECLEAMERQGGRAARLVSALLDLAHLDRGSFRLAIEPVHVGRAARAALESTPVPPATRVELVVPGDLTVAADRGRLDQVLVNLLSNAVRHGGCHILVSARRSGDMVEVTVSDDGPGVAPDMAARMFQPFARGHEAGGSGLGLAISSRVVQACGGSIHYAPGEPSGSRFVVCLPVADEATSAPDGVLGLGFADAPALVSGRPEAPSPIH